MTNLHGSSLLIGDNTTPGLKIHKELKEVIPKIFAACDEYGLDYYPTIIQPMTYDEISEIAAYSGFPVRYPHWSFGMEFEELHTGYMNNRHRIYELVINSSPCIIYYLDSNTLMDNIMVIAHALGHNDFFKNNIYFSKTNTDMLNKMANHGRRVRNYMARWGNEKVTEFMDHVLRIQTLIDPSEAWVEKKIKDPVIRDKREYKHPNRLDISVGHDYMDEYINPKEWLDKQRARLEKEEVANEIGILKNPIKNILGFIRDNAPLKPWQTDIAAMIYDEALYFAPQRSTKVINEGWASWIDYKIMAEKALAGLGQPTHDGGIVEYAKHKMGVLGGKYSNNPYKLGFSLLLDIEDRWNKGKFGTEYEECDNLKEKLDWDKNLGLGKDKVFEVRKYYNDYYLISEFFTKEFCEKNEYFEWKKYPNGEIKIETRDHKVIKKKLLERHTNGGFPEILLTDANYRGKGYLFLEHKWNGKSLHKSYTSAVLQSLYYLWGKDIYLSTKKKDGEEILYICAGKTNEDVIVITREEYESGRK